MTLPKHLPALDGLRAISILWVVLLHMPVGLASWLEPLRIRGDLGVELFFAISGFLVTRSLIENSARLKSAKDIASDFFLRRLTRILPPFLLILIVLSFAAIAFDPSLKQKLLSISDIWFSLIFYYFNYGYFLTDGTVPGTLTVIWSLAFEEQFYVLLILVFVLWPKSLSRSLFTLALVSISWRLLQSYIDPQSLDVRRIQYWSHLRLDAILWGGFFYLHRNKLYAFCSKYKRLLPLLILFVVSATVMHKWETTPLWVSTTYLLVSLSFSLLVFTLAVFSQTGTAQFLSLRPLAYVGKISYEIYLVHQFVIGLLVRLGFKFNSTLFVLAGFALSILVAAVFHQFFAKPCQKWLRHKLLPKK